MVLSIAVFRVLFPESHKHTTDVLRAFLAEALDFPSPPLALDGHVVAQRADGRQFRIEDYLFDLGGELQFGQRQRSPGVPLGRV